MAKAIMIQGTMSDAGKSLLAAALCRIFRQDGYSVAPFKSQNMALNSFITEEGLEMGRAQVVQAEAAKIKPQVSMNPILLKPSTDTTSQVIVNGEVRGNMTAQEYYAYKPQLRANVIEAYQRLSETYDIIVIEGAGSPAEINLRAEDFVNMGMAEIADAPVLLVGDIDRGGVFAQLIGTLILLTDEERERVKGLIINKFRGDKAILDPGTKMLEQRGEKPVLGVVPYLSVDVEDEDSLHEYVSRQGKKEAIDIVVICFPRISNFTDFAQFERLEGVSLRYVRDPGHLGHPDMIILPGTKSTTDDLLWMRQNGLESLILQQAAAGSIIFGICGGYQMLGITLSDPYHVEGTSAAEETSAVSGMGLLPADTVFTKEKIRTRVTGRIETLSGDLANLTDAPVEGYEIHMGVTQLHEDTPVLAKITDLSGVTKTDGACRGNIYGTYVHGIFDTEEMVNRVITAIGMKKGLDTKQIKGVDYHAYKETQYDKLADGVRDSLDMDAIYRIMGLK